MDLFKKIPKLRVSDGFKFSIYIEDLGRLMGSVASTGLYLNC